MKLWSEVLNKISEKISKPSFDTWFKNTTMEVEEDTIKVYAANEFARDWLAHTYGELIPETVKEITGKTYTFKYYEAENKKVFSYTYPMNNNTYSNKDSFINELQERMEQLEARVRQLEERG
ncbi:DnaA N-terminal domain-containing protein [Oceanobacillus saliphilus]|uniref:DnaA N-terminal domain-containing protein n=1 Tax=Oceanobacillus saliphilus TaxID=2925834 RepID=UPI00201D6F92|nr:DnaA N-terminal domain-containing protein [Oceanobacillus saliphilus]